VGPRRAMDDGMNDLKEAQLIKSQDGNRAPEKKVGSGRSKRTTNPTGEKANRTNPPTRKSPAGKNPPPPPKKGAKNLLNERKPLKGKKGDRGRIQKKRERPAGKKAGQGPLNHSSPRGEKQTYQGQGIDKIGTQGEREEKQAVGRHLSTGWGRKLPKELLSTDGSQVHHRVKPAVGKSLKNLHQSPHTART